MGCLVILRTVCAYVCFSLACNVSSAQQSVTQDAGLSLTQEPSKDVDYFLYQHPDYPKDCTIAQNQCSSGNSSGVYVIKPDGFQEPFEVFCTGGWTVMQRRGNGDINFNRSWSYYKDGFGFLSTDFWLGNEKLSYLTNQAVYELRVDFQLSDGRVFFTTYKGFRITDEFSGYKLTYIGAIENNASSLISVCPTNMKFDKCFCQGTCEDPNGEAGCYGNCLENEACVCPEGFLMQGNECIPQMNCGCFFSGANVVIPEAGFYVNEDCTRKCSCSNSLLSCEEDYSCDVNAACVTTDGVRQCSCNEGHEGDGQICETLFADCKDAYDAGHTEDGIYTILPLGWTAGSFSVYCRMDHGGGWTVFQRRVDDDTNFYQNWAAYKEGFGDINRNFWLGNEKLHFLTNQGEYKLRFDITTSSGNPHFAEYSEFQIDSEATNYTMNKLGSRTSNSGYAGYLHHNKLKQFSTYDRDNDGCSSFNCAERHKSGFWHANNWCSWCKSGSICLRFQYSSSCETFCSCENPNGKYNAPNAENIFSWDNSTWANNHCNLRTVEMKIRPSS